MTILERALEFVTNGSRIGLGSGRAAQAFVKALGERVRRGRNPMDANDKRTTSRCKDLHKLPPIFTDWIMFFKP